MDIITKDDLAAYLRQDLDDASAALYVALANGLVSEIWTTPVTPVPTWVKALTLEVAARAYRNPSGVTSSTDSLDDGSRTVRYYEGGSFAAIGIYLTDEERDQLAPNLSVRVPRTLQIRAPRSC